MNAKTFSDALGQVNEKYVSEAIEYKRNKKEQIRIKWVPIVACLVLIVMASIPLVQSTPDKLPTEIEIFEFNNALYEICEDNSILKKRGIHTNISKADAGEVISYLTKNASNTYIPAEEKTNIILYSYAAVPCEAVLVICDNGKYKAALFCGYVFANTESISFERFYELYNIKSASDIFSISVVNGRFEKKVVGTTLTDKNVISDFYSYSLILQDYSTRDYHRMNYGHISTEEELVKAYAKTAENELTIMIETADGLRFCMDYDADGGWIYNGLRYYRVTEEIADWFTNNLDRR